MAFVTLDHPPINLFDATLIGEVARVGAELAAADAVRIASFPAEAIALAKACIDAQPSLRPRV
ncbi:MAG TPA: hypothetical protein VNO26_01140 [Candidatus Limnocylindria bacterium]|nr:hypothetical protein [Candidatus Limnocylindria bacterium]